MSLGDVSSWPCSSSGRAYGSAAFLPSSCPYSRRWSSASGGAYVFAPHSLCASRPRRSACSRSLGFASCKRFQFQDCELSWRPSWTGSWVRLWSSAESCRMQGSPSPPSTPTSRARGSSPSRRWSLPPHRCPGESPRPACALRGSWVHSSALPMASSGSTRSSEFMPRSTQTSPSSPACSAPLSIRIINLASCCWACFVPRASLWTNTCSVSSVGM